MIAVALVAVVLAVTAAVVVLAEQRQLLDSLDRSLEERAGVVASTDAAPGGSLINPNGEEAFAQVIDGSGVVVASTANMSGEPPASGPPGSHVEVGTVGELAAEEGPFRVLAVPRASGEGGYVVVGESIDDLQEAVRALATTLAVVLPVAVVVMGALVWWLVGRTLRPVEEIREQVAGIGIGELDRRVPDPGTGDEIARLAVTMNDMLRRLQVASERQRRFTADASHELRTPLTRVRATLDAELARGAEAELDRAAAEVLDDLAEMQLLMEDLLFLAGRGDREPVRPVPVDLDVVVEREVARFRDARLEWDVADVDPVMVSGDERQLTRLLRNLLSNAQRHASRRVRVTLHEEGGSVRLAVEDDGPGIPPEDRERVFEPFARLDESRSSGTGGTGLGLAIARDVARSHGGSVTAGESSLGGARFQLELPCR